MTTGQLMLCREIIDVYSEIHTRYISTFCGVGGIFNLSLLNLVFSPVTGELYRHNKYMQLHILFWRISLKSSSLQTEMDVGR
jgi:hypothetical protein